LTTRVYVPDGTTALLDAIGLTTKLLQPHIGETTEYDTTCVVVILTDGHENASRHYILPVIRGLIKELEGTGKWTFSFIGATLDAVSVAEQMNINPKNSFSFEKKSMKRDVWEKLGDSVEQYVAKKTSGEKNLKDFF
jgi:hypothetical protein